MQQVTNFLAAFDLFWLDLFWFGKKDATEKKALLTELGKRANCANLFVLIFPGQ